MKRLFWVIFGTIFLTLATGCSGRTIETDSLSIEQPTEVAAAPSLTSTAIPTAQPTATAAETATAQPAPATATALPTSTVRPTRAPTVKPSAVPSITASITATRAPATSTAPSPALTATQNNATPAATSIATVPPPPPNSSGGVTQPPYAASACSDKYPCNDDPAGWEARIRVPNGYRAEYFALLPGQNLTGLTFGPDGLLYVASQQGTIYRVDSNGNASAYVGGLIVPTGMAFRPGTSQLFVSSRVREDNYGGEAQVSVIENGGIRQLIGGLPCCYAFMHGPHGIAFDSAGRGYVGVGARSDHGEKADQQDVQDVLQSNEAVILRFDPNSGSYEVYATGLRNPYGVAIDANNTVFATDNGPDFGPPDEFHRVVAGANHGFPYYECDSCFPKPAEVNPLPATYNFPAHSSPTGVTVYTGNQFPNGYNNIFVALWSAFPGAQKIVRFGPGGVGASTFATGFAAPIAVTTDPAGNLYVADWATGIIFKISYKG